MAVYVALLRGINLGKHKRVAMADLRSVLADAGHADVKTHLQSGNVILASRRRSARSVERAIEETLRTGLDLDIEVMVRTADELARIAERNPFLERGVDPGTLFVAFLKSAPPAAGARKLAQADFGREEFELQGSELYLRYPDGYGRSKMTGAFFERTLGTPATVRNWNVTTKLAELATAG